MLHGDDLWPLPQGRPKSRGDRRIDGGRRVMLSVARASCPCMWHGQDGRATSASGTLLRAVRYRLKPARNCVPYNMQRLLEIILGLDKGFLGKQGEFSIQFNPKWPLQ